VEPDENLIKIKDIAHALSMICRANGHTKIFYSVAQHSIACAKEASQQGLSKEIVLGCLLHDASEAYLSDVTRPIKKELKLYLEVEDRLQNLIWRHFIGRDLSDGEKNKVFEIDDAMLSMEFHQIMPEDIGDGYKNLIRDFECKYEEPERVAREFEKILMGV
jgi:hypothetical protein